MNPELCKLALEKVVNPNVLVNLISRRVRQLVSGGGGSSRPLIKTIENLGFADIALREIVEGKMGWELPEANVFNEEAKPKRRRKS
jgi:DNA-directed RNA polymerase subunit omega